MSPREGLSARTNWMYETRPIGLMLVVPLLSSPVCAGLTRGRDSSFVRSYDTVWEATVVTKKLHLRLNEKGCEASS